MFRKIKGFTLMELMLVVTIIGILSCIAIPAYQRANSGSAELAIRKNLTLIWGAAQKYMLEKGATFCTIGEIISYKLKNSETPIPVENPGITNIIKQVSNENYANIKCIYEDDGPKEGVAGTIYQNATRLFINTNATNSGIVELNL